MTCKNLVRSVFKLRIYKNELVQLMGSKFNSLSHTSQYVRPSSPEPKCGRDEDNIIFVLVRGLLDI